MSLRALCERTQFLNRRNEQITVFGGTGYLGQHIVRHLGQGGYRVRVAVRHPQAELFQNMGDAVEQVQADVTDEPSVTRAIRGSDATVNAVGLYIEKGAISFDAVHVLLSPPIWFLSLTNGLSPVSVSPGSNSPSVDLASRFYFHTVSAERREHLTAIRNFLPGTGGKERKKERREKREDRRKRKD